jgi:hypothetical protein
MNRSIMKQRTTNSHAGQTAASRKSYTLRGQPVRQVNAAPNHPIHGARAAVPVIDTSLTDQHDKSLSLLTEGKSSRDIVFADPDDPKSWQSTPKYSTNRSPAPLPSYAIKNRRLAAYEAEVPRPIAIRKSSDIGMFHKNATNGVNRYTREQMQLSGVSGEFRRKKSDIGKFAMEAKFGHTRPMRRDPQGTGTFRLQKEDVNRSAWMPDLSLAE